MQGLKLPHDKPVEASPLQEPRLSCSQPLPGHRPPSSACIWLLGSSTSTLRLPSAAPHKELLSPLRMDTELKGQRQSPRPSVKLRLLQRHQGAEGGANGMAKPLCRDGPGAPLSGSIPGSPRY